jgi:RimJ/RimL family protein N-acetyltransferase
VSKIYSIEKINGKKYSDEDWKKYFQFRSDCAKLKDETLHFNTWKKLKKRSQEFISDGIGIYVIFNNNNPFGHFTLNINFKDNPEKRFVYFHNFLVNEVLDNHILSLVFSTFLKFDYLSKFLVIVSKDNKNDFINDILKAEVGGQCELFELDICNANIDVIDDWFSNSQSKFSQFNIKFYQDIPPNLLQEYCSVFTELCNDMPANTEVGDLNISVERVVKNQNNARKNNSCSYRFLVLNEENKLIAKTNVYINKNKPEIVYQYMTGVLREYRGIGLSKWVKAAMFKKLIADFPSLKIIETATHPENYASRELSKQMGYKKVGYKEEFVIARNDIEGFVNEKLK